MFVAEAGNKHGDIFRVRNKTYIPTNQLHTVHMAATLNGLCLEIIPSQ